MRGPHARQAWTKSRPVGRGRLVLSAGFIPNGIRIVITGQFLTGNLRDHRGFNGALGLQFAHAVPRPPPVAGAALAPAERGPRWGSRNCAMAFSALFFPSSC